MEVDQAGVISMERERVNVLSVLRCVRQRKSSWMFIITVYVVGTIPCVVRCLSHVSEAVRKKGQLTNRQRCKNKSRTYRVTTRVVMCEIVCKIICARFINSW